MKNIDKTKVQSTWRFCLFKRLKRREEGTLIKMKNVGLGLHSVEFGSRFGARWILKRSPNRPFSHKIKIQSRKKGGHGHVFEKHCFLISFRCQMGGLEKQKQAFRIIFVAEYEFSGSCDI